MVKARQNLSKLKYMKLKQYQMRKKVARTIADSLLVKTAINGEDPNWGRIVSAAGYAGVFFDESKLKLSVNKITIYKKGLPVTPVPKKIT